MNRLSDLLWQLRVRNRLMLAWWAFRNPDQLTMLRHEMALYTVEREFGGHRTRCALLAERWAKRYLNIPVR